MNVHEHQAKALLPQNRAAVPRGCAAFAPEEAAQAAADLGGAVRMVKAHGKAGAVKVVHSIAEIRQTAAALLGREPVTPRSVPVSMPKSRALGATCWRRRRPSGRTRAADWPRRCATDVHVGRMK